MEVAIDANEHFLHQILGTLTVADRPVDEVQQAHLIPVYQRLKRPLLPLQEELDHRRVVQGRQQLAERNGAGVATSRCAARTLRGRSSLGDRDDNRFSATSAMLPTRHQRIPPSTHDLLGLAETHGACPLHSGRSIRLSCCPYTLYILSVVATTAVRAKWCLLLETQNGTLALSDTRGPSTVGDTRGAGGPWLTFAGSDAMTTSI